MSTEVRLPDILETLSSKGWQSGFSSETQTASIEALEAGRLIFFPHLAFHLFPNEMALFDETLSNEKRKNISFHPVTGQIRGIQKLQIPQQQALHGMLQRFSEHARLLVENLFPTYQSALIWGRTSYRPSSVTNKPLSPRKDDKRLHVDAFPASPNQGKRILRVFCNINPHGEDRVWRIGEPFETVVNRFLKRLSRPWPTSSKLLKLFQITKSKRTAYDHYMLQLHDKMKTDEDYQKNVSYLEMRFPPGSAWIVQTDQVSHAAMKGQFMLEQTFYLPINAMQDQSHSPLRVLEKKLGKKLV